MKRIKVLVVGLLMLFLMPVVWAERDILDDFETVDVAVKMVTNVVGYKDGYILSEEVEGTTLYSYSNDMELKATKKLDDLKQAKIILNGEYFLVVGVSSNTLKVYLLDSNLKVLKQNETAHFIQASSEIHLYHYDERVYVMLTYDDNLIQSTIYEIDGMLKVQENKFSSYQAAILKNIFKGDYYLIHNNDKEEEGEVTHYTSSTYLNEKNILVGNVSNVNYDEELGYDERSIMTFLDAKGSIVNEIVNEDFLFYRDVVIVKDKIVALGKSREHGNELVIFDKTGKVLEEIILDSMSDEVRLEKLGNQVWIMDENSIIRYSFLVNIYKEEDTFGSIEFNEVVQPYDMVKVNVVPNSGYKVKEIVVLDSQGNRVLVEGDTFLMPANDVFIHVEYEEVVENPETWDVITFAVLFLVLLIPISVHLYKKMAWLR